MRQPLVRIVVLSLSLGALLMTAVGPWTVSAQETRMANAVQRLLDRARVAQRDPANENYAGWLAYLTWRSEHEMDGPGGRSRSVDEFRSILADWLDRIATEPQALAQQRGNVEWAYLSNVDGTGQPFTIAIPYDYDPDRAWPLVVELHGFGASYQVGQRAVPESFIRLRPQGRNRGGVWHALSEVDVIEALDYARSHWHIDPDRVHIGGCSMGGYGAWLLGSRHPGWFASAVPVGGYAPDVRVENLLNVPVYGLHYADDPAVEFAESQEPTRRLNEFGGRAVLDELPGEGHCVSPSTPRLNLDRLSGWRSRQARPEAVRRVHYTAMDELARGAYWVEVAEWGPEGRPASIDARIGYSNDLHVTLDNVGTVRIDVAAAPVDRADVMTLAIDGVILETLMPPLPDSLFIIRDNGSWHISEERPPVPPHRLHFPGGSMALFHGEPIMAVWGTQGDEETNKGLHDLAQIARQSHSPTWWGEAARGVRPGAELFEMLYGRLAGKPDVEVTTEDMATYNLLLFGDARQNTVVARMADRLPVHIADGRLHASDGFSWSFDDRALGLLYYNPLAPRRLVYWVAFDQPERISPQVAFGGLTATWAEPAPADFLVLSASRPNATNRPQSAFVAARRFDSRWNWESGYGDSPLVSDDGLTEAGYSSALGRALRLASGADYALVDLDQGSGAEGRHLAGGETRLMDLVATEYDRRIVVAVLTGQEIIATIETLDEMVGQYQNHDRMRLLPDPRPEGVDPDRLYRVAMKGWTEHWANDHGVRLESFRATDHTVREAIRRFWPVVTRDANH